MEGRAPNSRRWYPGGSGKGEDGNFQHYTFLNINEQKMLLLKFKAIFRVNNLGKGYRDVLSLILTLETCLEI